MLNLVVENIHSLLRNCSFVRHVANQNIEKRLYSEQHAPVSNSCVSATRCQSLRAGWRWWHFRIASIARTVSTAKLVRPIAIACSIAGGPSVEV